MTQYKVERAEQETYASFGDEVSVLVKQKSLLKFGLNTAVGTSRETVWETGGDETYVSTNIIDSISSSAVADTEVITVEGHTIDVSTGEFTFVIQQVTLNGRTRVALATPLARVSRAFNDSATSLVGDVYVYQNTDLTNGVPDDASKVHITITGTAGRNQSFKAATTLSSQDYLFVSNAYASCRRGNSTVADIVLEVRSLGKIFRPRLQFSVAQPGGVAVVNFEPYLIVPKNADIRISATASASNTGVSAGFQGYLAKVI